MKMLRLEARDGKGLLAYAGLGATSHRVEPSSWMCATLRGRAGLTFEQNLAVLHTVASRELRPFLRVMPGHMHQVLAAAVLDDGQREMYTIANWWDPVSQRFGDHFTRHRFVDESGPHATRRLLALGSGAVPMAADKAWLRPILRAIAARDRGLVPDTFVADQLAAVNVIAHKREPATVGPNSVVAWIDTSAGGGGFQFYEGSERADGEAILPSIARGLDVASLMGAMMDALRPQIGAVKEGDPPSTWWRDDTFSDDAFRATLAKLPDQPDERLR